MAQVALSQATIDYRVVGPQDSPHPPILFVHGALVDQRVWALIGVPDAKTFVALDDPAALVNAITTVGAHSATRKHHPMP